MDRRYSLDAMRGVAALAVVLYHVHPSLGLANSGYLAVDLFFALSGIVIAGRYGPPLRAGQGAGAFLAQRVIRLYPMYLVGLILGAAELLGQYKLGYPQALRPAEVAWAALAGIVMLPARTRILPLYPLNGPSWTLMFELLANIAFAALLVRWRARWLAGLCLMLLPLLIWSVHPDLGLERGGAWSEIPYGLLRVGFSFTLGVWLYEAVLRDRVGAVSTGWMLSLVLVALALSLAPPPGFRGGYDLVVVVLLFPALLVAGARWDPPARWRGIATWLGDVSYPLYAVHYPLLFVMSFAARRMAVPTAIWVPAMLVGLLILAHVLARLVDPVARRWLTARWMRADLSAA